MVDTLAHAYANEIVYIFETGRDLLRIPTCPSTGIRSRSRARACPPCVDWLLASQTAATSRDSPKSWSSRKKGECGIIP